MATIVWFRKDLRVEDHPALTEAVNVGEPIVPLYIHGPEEEGEWSIGGASRVWLHHSLTSLQERIRSIGGELVFQRGSSEHCLLDLVKSTGAKRVFWSRCYEPALIKRDAGIKSALQEAGVEAVSFNGSLLREPWEMKTKTGGPYQVYTPFWRALSKEFSPRKILPAPKTLPAPLKSVRGVPLDALGLLPRIRWDKELIGYWKTGDVAALSQLHRMLSPKVGDYKDQRDLPAIDGTSKLSPHLHFGEISPTQIWNLVGEFAEKRGGLSVGAEHFLKEVVWREFGYHLIFHFPTTPLEPLRTKYAKFPWRENPEHLRAWQQGQTGYPIVDAGMRQLYATGWMHNRVRMVVASFLVKHLLLPWQEGAKWFWDTLVDADLASNTLGWQWAAGCGADAAPYFRIFNPVTQGEKFDSKGDYVRRWVPELKRVPSEFIHQPWTAPSLLLLEAGVTLGENYPRPIVDHKEAREAALEALATLKGV